MEAHESENLMEEYLHVLTDPAHMLAEVTSTIIFDLLIVGLFWGVIFKTIILPRVRRDIHAEIDREHGITHDEETND